MEIDGNEGEIEDIESDAIKKILSEKEDIQSRGSIIAKHSALRKNMRKGVSCL